MRLELRISTALVLRELGIADAAALAALIAREQHSLAKWFGWVAALSTPKGAAQYLQQTEEYQKSNSDFGVYLNGALIGGISLQAYSEETKRLNIGYWIATRYQRQGIAAKCLKSILHYLFDEIGLEKVEAYVLPANTASIALLQRLGFRTEGLLRRWQYLNGGLQDTYVFGMLREELRVL